MRCVTFDKNGENIFFVKNDVHFEQQAVSSDHGVVMRMQLQEAVAGGQLERNVSVSDDGTFSALGGGDDNPYWYLIDVGGQKVTKLTSKRLENAWAPCFINGETESVAIAGKAKVEIWDIQSMASLRVIGLGSYRYESVLGLYSVHNILAVGSWDRKIRLYDVRTWNMIYSKQYATTINSLHLTPDLKYMALGGSFGELGIVEKLH